MTRLGLLLMLILIASGGGCAGSRWARADPKYRQKYDHHTKDPARVVKQAIDARHVAGRHGYYLSGGGGDRNGEVAAGWFNYPEPLGGAVEGYVGLRGLVTPSGDGHLAGGLEGGVRLQSPSRVAPYVGVGLFGGYAPTASVEATDGGTEAAAAGGVSPEVGVHAWLTPRCRLSASAKHTLFYVEEGGSEDYTTFGVTLSFLDIPNYGERPARQVLDCGDTPPPLPTKTPPDAGSPSVDSPYAALLTSPESPPAAETTAR